MTEKKDLDTTQFIRLNPGELLPEDEPLSPASAPSPPVPSTVSGRRPVVIAVVLGLLAGALLLLVLAGLFRIRH